MKPILCLTLLIPSLVFAQPTPPVQPKLSPVPLPPAIQIDPVPSTIADAPLSADEAVRIALRLQPSLRAAQAAVLAAQGRIREAEAALRPTLGVTTGYTRFESIVGSSGGTSTGSNQSGFTSNASLRQLLFDFGFARNLVRQSREEANATARNLTRSEQDLALQVKQAFYTVIQNDRLVEVQESNLASRQAQLQLSEARLASGLGQPIDVVRATTLVGDASQSLAQARANALNSRIELALSMGVDPRTRIRTSDTVEPDPGATELNSAIDKALTQRPEVLSAESSLRAAQFGRSAADAFNRPSISASAGYGSRGPSDPFESQNATLAISLSIPLVDGGVSEGRKQQAKANVISAESQLATVRQSVVRDVSQAYVNLRTAEQRVTITQSQVENAREATRLAEGRFRAGVATFLEVTDAQATQVAAQTAFVNAQSAVQIARAALKRALGVQ